MSNKHILLLGARYLSPYILEILNQDGRFAFLAKSNEIDMILSSDKENHKKYIIIDGLDPSRLNLISPEKLDWLRHTRKQLTSALNIDRYIYLSSAHVYEESTELISEESSISRQNKYSELKLDTENYIKKNTDSAIILRLTNVWSNESADDTLMGACLKHVQHGIKLDITPSDDNKVVDLIHVDDVSKVIKDCIEQTCQKVSII